MTRTGGAPMELMSSQLGIWYAQQLAPENPAYNLGEYLEIRGAVDVALLVAALRRALVEAEAYRLRFSLEEHVPAQHLHDAADVPIHVADLSAEADPDAAALAWMRADLDRPVRLVGGVLSGHAVLRVAADRVLWYQRVHHAVIDGTSLASFALRTAEIYTALEEGRDAAAGAIEPLSVLLDADRGYRSSPDFAADRRYWLDVLADLPEVPRPSARRMAGWPALHVAELGAEATAGLRVSARRLRAGFASLAIAAAAVCQHRISGSRDLVLGVSVNGRTGRRELAIPGMTSNIMPIRLEIGRGASVAELLRQTSYAVREGLRHQRYQYREILGDLGLVGGGSPCGLIINVMALERPIRFGGCAAVRTGLSSGPADDLKIDVYDKAGDGELQTVVETNPELHGAAAGAEISDRYLRVLKALASAAPDAAAGGIDILGAEERRRVLVEWSGAATSSATVTAEPVVALFEARAERQPDAVALVHDGVELTYAELDSRANRLAGLLRSRGVRAESVVALCLPRGIEIVAAILAVWKAGAGYMPIDPELPAERIAFMLQDSRAAVLVGTRDVLDELPIGHIPTVALDSPTAAVELETQSATAPSTRVEPGQLAYVIYTSGSTGRPKGVAVAHGSVAAYAASVPGKLGLGAPGARYALLQAQVTDLGNTILFASLATGGELHILDAAAAVDPSAVSAYLTERRIDHLKAVPSHLVALSSVTGPEGVLPARSLVLGGEAAPLSWLRALLAASETCEVFNHYGPTEATIGVLTARLDEAAIADGAVPIGRPTGRVRVYVLDDELRPVPNGVPGELYIAGAQLARGYIGRAGLTAERFTACPFGTPGERMYRTGDVVSRLADGRLVFAGRTDEQVKIRGFRVEPGEVRTAVAAHSAVGQAAVLVRDDEPGQARLVAYVVPVAGSEPADDPALAESVRAFAAERLPAYMVPAAVVVLDALPLTANGKLDRAALPAPDFAAVAHVTRGPESLAEEILCQAFADVLGLPAVGVDDDFFALGGHSLLAVSLVEHLAARGLSLSVPALFKTPTPAGLGTVAGPVPVPVPERLIPEGATAITPAMLPLADLDAAEVARIVEAIPGGAGNLADVYPLSPLQEGIFFHHLARSADDADVYLMSAVLEFDARDRLDDFLGALQKVIDRHDIYRTAILWQGLREPMQVVVRHAELPIAELDIDASAPNAVERLRAAVGSWMELDRAPLLRIETAVSEGRCLALLRMHHLVRDHTTLEVMIGEVRAFLDGRGEDLPEPLPYRDFVAQARLGTAREEHAKYFADLLGDVEETTAPFGLFDVRGDGTDVAHLNRPIDDARAERVRNVARRFGVSPATLFHLAWARVLAAASARDDVVFGTVLLGRTSAGAGRVAGPFLNTLPVRVRLRDRSAAEALADLRHQLTGLFEHEHAPLAVAQQAARLSGGTPLFTSIFNYRHSRAVRESDIGLDGVRVASLTELTNYPLNVAVSDSGSGFAITVDALAPADPARVFAMLDAALGGLVGMLDEFPDAPFAAVPVLDETELHRILREWNRTAAPVAQPVPELIAARAALVPRVPAVACDGAVVSYAELLKRADRLARFLREAGVGAESVVALCLPRGVELVTAVLATWRAGAAYLPIDPDYPAERVAFMLADSRAAALIGTSETLEGLGTRSIRTLDLDDPLLAATLTLYPADAGERPAAPDPEALAYVMYTSGSTGRPKGVAVTHGGLANYVAWAAEAYASSGDGDAPLHSSPAFDLTVTSLLVPLVRGATVVADADGGAEGLARLIRESGGFGLVKAVPGHLPLLAEMLTDRQIAAAARHLVVGGAALPGADVRAWLERAPGTVVVNEYGPTETVVGCCVFEVAAGQPVDPVVPIGRPTPNTRLYVLDDSLVPAPVGVAGELYIAGAQLARGYLGRAGLTAERFAACPFESGQRMYRTGDRAYWTADGQLVFVGRADAQVKIRGYRVEPGEVEAVLTAHPEVSAAAVVCREDIPGDQRLVAYVVGADAESVRAFAAERLPGYLLPDAVVPLDLLPLTFNGKVDHAVLPAPDRAAGADSSAGRDPADEREAALCAAFAEVLALTAVGVEDDFFALGGHSLLATRLVSRVRTLLGVELPIEELFTTPTPAALAAWLAEHAAEAERAARPALRPTPREREMS